jgi:hypothetical protein
MMQIYKCPFCGQVRETRQDLKSNILCHNCQLNKKSAEYNKILFMRSWGFTNNINVIVKGYKQGEGRIV